MDPLVETLQGLGIGIEARVIWGYVRSILREQDLTRGELEVRLASRFPGLRRYEARALVETLVEVLNESGDSAANGAILGS